MDSCSNPLVFRTRTALLRSAIFAKRRQGRELSSGSQLGNEECQTLWPTRKHILPSLPSSILSLAIHPALYSCFLYTRIYNSHSFRYTTAVSILTSYKIGALTIRRHNIVVPSHILRTLRWFVHILLHNVCLELFVSIFIFNLKHFDNNYLFICVLINILINYIFIV